MSEPYLVQQCQTNVYLLSEKRYSQAQYKLWTAIYGQMQISVFMTSKVNHIHLSHVKYVFNLIVLTYICNQVNISVSNSEN